MLTAFLNVAGARTVGSMPELGTINRVDNDHGAIVIGDIVYALAPNVRTLGPNLQTTTIYDLKRGARIRFERSGSRRQISKIWILP